MNFPFEIDMSRHLPEAAIAQVGGRAAQRESAACGMSRVKPVFGLDLFAQQGPLIGRRARGAQER